jgi:hypothetical protein
LSAGPAKQRHKERDSVWASVGTLGHRIQSTSPAQKRTVTVCNLFSNERKKIDEIASLAAKLPGEGAEKK